MADDAATRLAFKPDEYITDGTRLLRIVEWGGEGESIVEDCVKNRTAPELIAGDWRKVTFEPFTPEPTDG